VSREYEGRPLVFARSWYPGYPVRLDGTAVEYRLAGDILPEVILPAGFSGTLEDRLSAGGLPARLPARKCRSNRACSGGAAAASPGGPAAGARGLKVPGKKLRLFADQTFRRLTQ
jgi:hypothetical protein